MPWSINKPVLSKLILISIKSKIFLGIKKILFHNQASDYYKTALIYRYPEKT